ncbi:melanopsin isoform X2 [Aplysia californica]|uniref:Melanopsin isoform X2 n=1 Tax=Aplysia californica TaxID=6500 RepID=A0ABM0JC09_APLCA|nr:melanopsin isoform X2 [Aplysia californica]
MANLTDYIPGSGLDNLTLNSTGDSSTPKWSFEFSVTLATIMSISALVNVVGNSMVLTVIIRHRGMRTRTNLFLVNLAVADLFVGVLVMPFSIITLIKGAWIFNDFVCKLNGFLTCLCLVTSFHTLMYIGIHKYFSIVRPLRNPLKLKMILAMMAAAWVWAIVCSILVVAGLVVEYKRGTSQCGPKYPNDLQTFVIHGIIQISDLIMPFLILVFCYSRMFSAIKEHSTRLRNHTTVEEDVILSQQKKVTITMFIVLACFIMMAFPYFLYATYVTIKKDKDGFSSVINPLAYAFLYLNSMCNPIIYAFRSPAFREGYKEILCQTPSYVISDDSEHPHRTGRFSSIVENLRRGSSLSSARHSITNSLMLDPDAASLPGGQLGQKEKQQKRRLSKQKSLFDLLRSTRQSNAQSVVQRNGDTIIMKGGKIVSVRRGGDVKEGNPFISKLKTIKDAAAAKSHGLAVGLAGPGQVMFEVSYEGVEDSKAMGQRDSMDTESRWSDDVFMTDRCSADRGGAGRHGVYSKADMHSRTLYNNDEGFHELDPKANKDATTKQQNLPSGSSELKVQHQNSNNNVSKNPGSEFGTNSALNTRLDSLGSRSNISSPRRSSVPIIAVSDMDGELSPRPLSPDRHPHLTKSDTNLSPTRAPNGISLTNPRFPVSRSSNQIFRKPVFARLPSLEYLDPPTQIIKSFSSASLRLLKRKSPDKEMSSGAEETV